MIKTPKINEFMDNLSKLIDSYKKPEEEEEDEEDEEYEEEEFDDPFMTRMTKCYNFLVDAIEFMPVSSSKEFKFKKDKDKAKSFFLKLSNLAKEYHNFLNRMKQVVGA